MGQQVNSVLGWLVGVQAGIHEAVADLVSQYSASGDWTTLMSAIPLAVLFGMVHAMTPGHNKIVLATYVAGERLNMAKGLMTSALLSTTHIGSAVAIALGANWLVSRTITSAGRAPAMEIMSGAVLVAIGVWMFVRSIRRHGHGHAQNGFLAVGAGLIPCPLTMFVMVFAVSQGVPEAGVVFAASMLIGVGTVLCCVAAVAVLAAGRSLARLGPWAGNAARVLEALAGGMLVLIGVTQLL